MVFQSYDVLHCIVGEGGMSYSCSCHIYAFRRASYRSARVPTLVCTCCLSCGGGRRCFVCFSGKRQLGVGPRHGDIKGRDDIIFVSGSIVAPFECPTSMRRL